MNRNDIENMVNDMGESILLADGFDDAFMGVGHQFNTPIAVYSVCRCIEILMEDGLSYEEAVEYFEYNVAGSYMGEQTPIFLNNLD